MDAAASVVTEFSHGHLGEVVLVPNSITWAVVWAPVHRMITPVMGNTPVLHVV